MNAENIKERAAFLLKNTNLAVPQIAKETGISKENLSKCRAGDILLSVKAAESLADYLQKHEKQANMPELSTRFLDAINSLGITGYKLTKEIPEITQPKLTHIRNGRNEPSKSILASFLNKYPQINPEWLYTGEGKMFKTPIEENQKNKSKPEPEPSFQSNIPLIPIEAIAGFPDGDIQGIGYEECEHYNIPEFVKSGVEFVIRVSGSSMYPKYSNGDLLACRKIDDILFFQWGKVYVIDSSQGALVKRIFEDRDNPDNIILVSDNKESYPAFPMPKNDIRSLSIVLGVIRME
jgi:phage repressor protein C with HTH and peptisase S24 domain